MPRIILVTSLSLLVLTGGPFAGPLSATTMPGLRSAAVPSAALSHDSVDRRASQGDSPVPPAAMTIEGYVEELEAAAYLDTLHGGGHAVVHDQLVPRTDSIWRQIDSLVRRHVAELNNAALAPRYFLGLAHLELQLGQDAAAEQHLQAWLRTPGVKTVDSVIAFRLMVEGLLRRDVTTTRIASARQYLARLTAFPPTVSAGALFAGRLVMMGMFDGRGQTDSAVAWGLKAYAVVQTLPYDDRAWKIVSSGFSLVALVRALAGLPNGDTRIDSLLTVLKVAVVPRPAEAAQDTTLTRYYQQAIAPRAEDLFGKVAWMGKPMPPFVATHWLNVAQPVTVSDAAPGARTLQLDDGVIRIIGFGWFTCGGCQWALRMVQRSLGDLPPGVQVIFNERSMGNFNGDFCTPDEEAEDLRKWYVERKHLTFPIAIWAPVKDSTPGGGLVPRESPLWRALRISVGPTVYIVDGRGVIRYLGFGFDQPYSKMTAEEPLRIALEAIVRERETRNRETREHETRKRDVSIAPPATTPRVQLP